MSSRSIRIRGSDQIVDKRRLNFAPHLHFSTRIYNFSSWSQLRRISNGSQAPRNAFLIPGIRFLVPGSNYSSSWDPLEDPGNACVSGSKHFPGVRTSIPRTVLIGEISSQQKTNPRLDLFHYRDTIATTSNQIVTLHGLRRSALPCLTERRVGCAA